MARKNTTKKTAAAVDTDGLTPKTVQIVVRSSHRDKSGELIPTKISGGAESKAAELARAAGLVTLSADASTATATAKGQKLAAQLADG